MIDTKSFYDYLIEKGIDTFFGVPDSLLKAGRRGNPQHLSLALGIV